MNHWITKVPDKIFLWDPHGTYIGYYYSHTDAKHYVGPQGFLGKHITDVLPVEDAAVVMECLSLAIESKQTQTGETHLILDGIPHTQTIQFVPYEDRVLGLVNDVPT